MHLRNQVKVKFWFSAKYVDVCRRKMQKMDGRTDSQTDTELWHSNMIFCTLNKVICKVSAQYVKARRRKVQKTVYFQYSDFQNGHNFKKNQRKLRKLKLNLYYSKTKSYAKFQLNMPKRVREKCGKLWIFSILHSERGITPSKNDGNWQHSNLICSTVKQSHM